MNYYIILVFILIIIFSSKFKFLKQYLFLMGIGDWRLGIGDWGLGPIPNPQSPKNFFNLNIHKIY
jgi:hypothetical protein